MHNGKWNILEANLWSRVQSVNLWSNLKSESYLFQGRSRMESKNQKGRQFLHRPRGQQSLHCPDILRKEQQLSHRSQIQNEKFWNAQMPAKRGCNIWRRRGRSRRLAWKGVTMNSKTPILSHSQLLGGWGSQVLYLTIGHFCRVVIFISMFT